MNAKNELDKEKLAKNMPDTIYQKRLEQIRKGNLESGEKVPVLTVIIKPMDSSSYKNMVDALDEMQICSISKYVIDKVTPEDEKLLELKGVEVGITNY